MVGGGEGLHSDNNYNGRWQGGGEKRKSSKKGRTHSCAPLRRPTTLNWGLNVKTEFGLFRPLWPYLDAKQIMVCVRNMPNSITSTLYVSRS